MEQDPTPVRDPKRLRIGVAGVGVGLALVVLGVLWAHFTGLAPTNHVGREIYPHIPRCLPFEETAKCWVLPTAGHLVAITGSQIFLAAILYAWVLGRPLTWMRAALGAGLFTLEMILLFGVVPNQWLALTQGTFEWTDQKIAITLPTWLMLGNEVSISFAVIKDAVAGGYAAGLLGTIAVVAYKVQERAKKQATAAALPPPPRISSFGRVVVKGER